MKASENLLVKKVGIISVAEEMPQTRVSADELASQFGRDPMQFKTELGLKEKHIALGEDEHPSDICARAGRKAIEAAEIKPYEIGCVIYTSSSRDYLGGWCGAAEVIGSLRLPNAYGFDISNGCAGSIIGLNHAKHVASSEHPYVLIVSGERWAHTLSPKVELPLGTVAHGDGGAACVVGPTEENEIRNFEFNVVPQYNGFIYIPAGGTREPLGSETFKRGRQFRTKRFDIPVKEIYVKNYVDVLKGLMRKCEIEPSEVSLLAMNQGRASMRNRIIDLCGIDRERCPSSYENYGHVGSADLMLVLNKHFSKKSTSGWCLLAASNVSFYGALAIQFKESGRIRTVGG